MCIRDSYKVDNDSYEQWSIPGELNKQIELNRNLDNIKGSIFYNTSSLRKNPLNIQQSLNQRYTYPALIPFASQDNYVTKIVGPNLKKVKHRKKGLRIKWKRKGKTPHYYVVYKFYGNNIGDFENPRSIWYISPFNPEKKVTLYDTDYRAGQPHTYVVAAVDRFHLERISQERTVLPKDKR